MLSYFKLNDPLRLLPLAVLALVLKLPVLLHPVPLSETTHWFVIGEAMQKGSMYVDIWDGMAPFAAVVYQLETLVWGRSMLALLLLGTLVTYFQAIIINSFSQSAKFFEKNTYLPALIYIVLTSTNQALFILSPALMGLTLVLLGLSKLVSHVEFRTKKDLPIILMALYFGSAPLFYSPFLVATPIAILLLVIFSTTYTRRYFLIITTSIMPLTLVWFYYWIESDHPGYFINNFFYLYSFDKFYNSISLSDTAKILGANLLIFMAGLVSMGKQRRLTNYQYRIIQLFAVLGLLLLLVLLLDIPVTPTALVIFVPVFAVFGAHFTHLIHGFISTTIASLVLIIMPLLLLWGAVHTPYLSLEEKPLTPTLQHLEQVAANNHVMVLGSAKNIYNHAQLAGPFYDWGLSKPLFNSLSYYDNLAFIEEHILEASPDLIIDLNEVWPKIKTRLPDVAKKYELKEPFVYELKR